MTLWEKYIETHFNDQREEIASNTQDPDDILADVLKLIEEQYLTNLFNKIYETGITPEEWLRSTFVAIPKKQNEDLYTKNLPQSHPP